MADPDGDLLQMNGVGANALATEHEHIIESAVRATIFDIDIMSLIDCLQPATTNLKQYKAVIMVRRRGVGLDIMLDERRLDCGLKLNHVLIPT